MLYNSRVFKDIYKKKFEVQNSEKRIQNEKMKQKFSFESPSFSSSSFSDSSSSSVDNQQQTKNKSKIKTYSKKTTFELHQFDIAQTEKFVPKYRGSVSMVPTSFNIIDILKSKNKEKNDNTKRKSYLENQLVNDKKFMNIIENAYKKKYDKKEDLIDKSKNFIEKRRQSQIILKNINNFNINNNQKKNKSRFSSIVIPNKINLFDDNNNIIIDNKSNNSSPFNIKKNVKKIASENAINKYKINNSNSHSKIHKNNIEKISFDIKQFKINLPKKHDLKFTHFNLKNNNLPTINSIDNNKNTTESYTNTYYNDYKYSNEFLFKSENEFNLNRNKDLLNIIEKHKPFENKNLFKINYHKKNKSNNTNNIAIKNGNKNIKILITAPNKKEYFFNAKNHKKKLYNFLEKIETLRNFVTTPGHDSLISF
jgi:hypothetical protein